MSDRPAPAWRKEPPTVEEVRGGMTWWWYVCSDDEIHDPPWPVMLRIYGGTKIATGAMVNDVREWRGEWCPCLPPPAAADLAALRERVREAETAIAFSAAIHRNHTYNATAELLDHALATLRELAARVGVRG